MNLFVILTCLWYIPYFVKIKDRSMPLWRYATALLLGAIPAFFIAAWLEIAADPLVTQLSQSWIIRSIIKSLLLNGVLEELIKYGFARLALVKTPPLNKIEFILMFGAVGLGFEITESILSSQNILTSLIRCIFALHVFLQYYMGSQYYEKQKDARSKVKMLAVPMLIHGVYNLSLDLLGFAMTKMNQFSIEAAVYTIIFVVIQTISIIFIIRMNQTVITEVNDK